VHAVPFVALHWTHALVVVLQAGLPETPAHCVSATHCTHIWVPLQTPVAHAVPTGSSVHCPIELASVHDMHVVAQAELQHTPLTQCPLWHCRLSPPVHGLLSVWPTAHVLFVVSQ
jgi:hypothetical protein